MKNEIEQIKALKELLDSGSITQSEFEEMKARITKGETTAEPKTIMAKKNRNLIISAVVLLCVFGAYFLFFNDSEFEKHAQELALADCKCKEENNNSYITSLETIKTELGNGEEILISEDYEKRLEEYLNTHKNYLANPTLKPCLDKFDQLKRKFLVEYPQTSRDGKDFWVLYQNQVQNNEDLAKQSNRINGLIDEVKGAISKIPFKSESDFTNAKNNTISLMEDFCESYGNESFDAHDWFTGTVEYYIKRKNVSPGKINQLYYDPNLDHVNVYIQLLPQTFKFKGVKEGYPTWEFTTDFQCYRPSRYADQYSKVVYEIKVDNNKLRSFREVKAYNTIFESIPQ